MRCSMDPRLLASGSVGYFMFDSPIFQIILESFSQQLGKTGHLLPYYQYNSDFAPYFSIVLGVFVDLKVLSTNKAW